ncbi:unnamed protein product, partial [Staurois parvus]
PVSLAALCSQHWHLQCGHPAVIACGYHSLVLTEYVRVALRFVNGPVVFWDLSRVPED